MTHRFENAHALDPFRPDACRYYMQSLCKKWGGSNLASFEFARWLDERSPPDSPAREVLPIAHISNPASSTARKVWSPT